VIYEHGHAEEKTCAHTRRAGSPLPQAVGGRTPRRAPSSRPDANRSRRASRHRGAYLDLLGERTGHAEPHGAIPSAAALPGIILKSVATGLTPDLQACKIALQSCNDSASQRRNSMGT